MCNLLIYVFLKNKNTKFSPKKYKKMRQIYMTYVTQINEFITIMINNVIILTRLHENVSKILFLDVNVNNFLLDENVKKILLEENMSNFYWT